jgi:hypothetical protein
MPSLGEKRRRPEQHGEFSRLRVTVGHLLDAWPAILQRRHFLRAMARSEALRAALKMTYAAHVFNSMHAAFSFDLVRGVGSLILDRDQNTASLWRAVHSLRKPTVVGQLRSQVYGTVPPIVGPASEEVRSALEEIQRHEYDSVFDSLPAQLDEIDATVFNVPTAGLIRSIRNKTVAHSALALDGTEWKIWAVSSSDTQLTYAELDEYIDACTKAVDGLAHAVLRKAFVFDDWAGINQRYADEYIDALVLGLSAQKEAKERQREENLRRARERIASPLIPPTSEKKPGPA